jgi:hypothetical protein
MSKIMNVHDGPGVIPGRYAGEPIRVHEGPTPEAVGYEEQRKHADALAGKICAAAAEAACSQYVLLELLGEFDAIRYWTDFKSMARWLAWCCSMTPGVAREHVRVAKAPEDADDREPVSGGPVVVLKGAGGDPGCWCGR